MSLELLANELIEMNNEYKNLGEQLKTKRLSMYNAFIAENETEIELENNFIYKREEREQLRIVNRENLLNILSEKISDPDLISEILSEVLYESSLSSGIRIVSKN